MVITFADRKLEKWANNYALALRLLGKERATKYHQRLGDMRDAESFNDLQYLPGSFHNLSGNRNGQWACNLDHPYRLVFKPGTDPVPVNEHGTPVLTEIRIVDILEIIDYH